MNTDQRTGMRSIRAAREAFAAVAVCTLLLGTILRCVDGRPGGVAGVILTLMALAVLSRYRVSWDRDGIICSSPFRCTRRSWSELSAYSIESDGPAFGPLLQGLRLRLHSRSGTLAVGLLPYSFQDIKHLRDAVGAELAAREDAEVLVS